MNDEVIRLECLKEILKHQGGSVDDAIEAAKKAADFVISGGDPSRRQGSQRKG